MKLRRPRRPLPRRSPRLVSSRRDGDAGLRFPHKRVQPEVYGARARARAEAGFPDRRLETGDRRPGRSSGTFVELLRDLLGPSNLSPSEALGGHRRRRGCRGPEGGRDAGRWGRKEKGGRPSVRLSVCRAWSDVIRRRRWGSTFLYWGSGISSSFARLIDGAQPPTPTALEKRSARRPRPQEARLPRSPFPARVAHSPHEEFEPSYGGGKERKKERRKDWGWYWVSIGEGHGGTAYLCTTIFHGVPRERIGTHNPFEVVVVVVALLARKLRFLHLS